MQVSIPSKNHLSTPGHQSYLYQNIYICKKKQDDINWLLGIPFAMETEIINFLNCKP